MLAKPIIVALDFPQPKAALDLAARLDPACCRVKVGKELFTRGGPQLVREIIGAGFEVFLDLKFHDIPNTVAGAVRAAADLGVWMVNVHASGGRAMLEAAREALGEKGETLLVGVTVLTSLNAEDLQDLNIKAEPAQQVAKLTSLCIESGLDGVVCSAWETASLRRQAPHDFILVTPGIRSERDRADDQKRVQTPAAAIANGSTHLVIGRSITRAEDPAARLQAIEAEIRGKI